MSLGFNSCPYPALLILSQALKIQYCSGTAVELEFKNSSLFAVTLKRWDTYKCDGTDLLNT